MALFANVSKETDERLMAGGYKLRPEEWVGGDIPWLIELVAPFGAQEEIFIDLSKSIFTGRPFKFHRINAQGQREVAIWDPETATASDPN